jgi:uncharacterized protein (DUF305 family)
VSDVAPAARDARAAETDAAASAPRRGLVRSLVALIAVFGVLAAAAVGWLLRGGDGSAATPSTTSVDAGFARDMSTHHRQAIIMAGYERDNTSDPGLRVLATDIETSQEFQVGEMEGWLATWGLPFTTGTSQMAWMGGHRDHVADHLMPGMATPDQLDRLEALHGRALDVLFLQLMIRHHQGGLPMARYALAHAAEPHVRDLAQSMVNSQTAEIIEMEQLLRQLGGHPLAPPDE